MGQSKECFPDEKLSPGCSFQTINSSSKVKKNAEKLRLKRKTLKSEDMKPAEAAETGSRDQNGCFVKSVGMKPSSGEM